MAMSSNRRRTPCETESCDSTTLGSEFPDSGQPRYDSRVLSFGQESALDEEKFNSNSDSLRSDPEKKPDPTFPGPENPPSYTPGLFENNVQNYRPAAAHQESNMSRLYSELGMLPVTALGYTSLYKLSLRLDPEMLPAQNWKMMSDYMGFNQWEIKKFEEQPLRAKAVIEAWAGTGLNATHTIGELLDIMRIEMNRIDVITDLSDQFLRDAERYKDNLRRGGDMAKIPVRSASYAGSIPQSSIHSFPVSESFTAVTEANISEKPAMYNESLPVQVASIGPSTSAIEYDAFVLCNIADKDFVVDRFLPKVEDEAGLRLCFMERDMPPGNLTFYDQMDYMFSKCKKLVVILSDEFFSSSEHDWQANLAIAKDPASKDQHVIPVKYKKTNTRNIFDHLGCCDLTRTMKEEWFWNKIIKAIKS